MNDTLIPDEQWKAAATQEGVDYGAVQKSFMDQSYGVVANKAKILFQDPFRLGFEIVHRNEKATKMVGIFAFRVNKNLLYAPTFFVNGEIKAADMLYRADVKRFVPLDEDWCAHLVRGVHETSGDTVDKNRLRQPDAYMDRLAYPQRVKYASEEEFASTRTYTEDRLIDLHDTVQKEAAAAAANPGVSVDLGADHKAMERTAAALADMPASWVVEMEAARDDFSKAAADGSLWVDMLSACADDTPIPKILPRLINDLGPEVLEKVAAMVEDNPIVERFLVTNYTQEELETVNGWLSKEAAVEGPQPAIVINMDPNMAKSASTREDIFDKGYELVDKRPPEMVNSVIEEVGDGTLKELSSPGKVSVLLDNGKLEEALILRLDRNMFDIGDYPTETHCADYPDGKPECVYFPKTKELLRVPVSRDIFGDELIDQGSSSNLISATDLKTGKCYIALSGDTLATSEALKLVGTNKDGDCTTLEFCNDWGNECKLHYAPGRSEARNEYISDETKFLEVKSKKHKCDDGPAAYRHGFNVECDKVLMSSQGIDDWIRTCGGVTSSREVTVKPNDDMTFDVTHTEEGTILKQARDLGMLEAHLAVAEDFCLTTDKAGEILNKAVDGDVTYRIFDTMSKAAYVTREEGMQDWIHSFDPEVQVRLDAPQQQVLSTYTPRRPDQSSRYGDVYQRVPAEAHKEAADILPIEAIMSQPPEQLAQMSEMYDMPHIFDHGCVGQMATTSHNIVDQIKKYIPDMESGVDRYFRILFLLRYRPSDFEEIYGQDDLVEFEQDLAELAARAGEQLLKMLKQFDPDQYSSQDN